MESPVRTIPNLHYCNDKEFQAPHKKHKLNLYLPAKNGEPFPVVLFVHGGGWKRGDRNWIRGMYGNVGNVLAKNGLACAVISYRLSRLSVLLTMLFGIFLAALATVGIFLGSLLLEVLVKGFIYAEYLHGLKVEPVALSSFLVSWSVYFVPTLLFAGIILMFLLHERDQVGVQYSEQVVDVGRALRWVLENAGTYNLDPSRVFLMGHSAGGHLVSLLALDPQYLEKAGLNKSAIDSIRGVITLSGVFHLGRLNKSILYRYWYLKAAFGDTDLRVASPITHARKTDFSFLLLNAAFDFHLSRDSQDFKEALEKVGGSAETRIIPRTNHQTIVSWIGRNRDATSQIVLDFIHKVLTNTRAVE